MKKINNVEYLKDFDQEYYEYVKDLLENPVVLKMKQFIQHGSTTCYDHCLNVSYKNYKICKSLRLLKLDARKAARAGMLHDLFLYDWHTEKNSKLSQMHGFTHPKTALKNAKKYFHLSEEEEDMILKHMFPLTIHLPSFKETYVIIFSDKICCLSEVIKDSKVYKYITSENYI